VELRNEQCVGLCEKMEWNENEKRKRYLYFFRSVFRHMSAWIQKKRRVEKNIDVDYILIVYCSSRLFWIYTIYDDLLQRNNPSYTNN
jgi:hypothetical protein